MSPPDLILVGESGIYTAKDVQRLAESGVHAVLVGESLILAPDRPAKLRELSGVSR
jgi:indole-3-glycerol phosphate synthase